MAIGRPNQGELSPREREQMDHEKEMLREQTMHVQVLKQLELEQARLEAKWASWLRIPVTIIKLPLYVVLSAGVAVAVARGKEIREEVVNLLK